LKDVGIFANNHHAYPHADYDKAFKTITNGTGCRLKCHSGSQADAVRTTTDNFPENTQYLSEVVCCFDKSFGPVPCPRQSFECKTSEPIALPSIEFDHTKRQLRGRYGRDGKF